MLPEIGSDNFVRRIDREEKDEGILLLMKSLIRLCTLMPRETILPLRSFYVEQKESLESGNSLGS